MHDRSGCLKSVYDARRLLAIADAAGLTKRYAIAGTQIHLAARQSLDEIPSLADLVAAEE